MIKEKQSLPYKEDSYYDDEISLVDLWLVLAARKWLIIGIAFLCLAAGAAYAFMEEPVYRYTTVIELARMGDGKPVEPLDSARARINQVIVPMVRSDMGREEVTTGERPPRASVHIPSGGERLLEIISEYPETAHDNIRLFHERLLASLQAEHDGRVAMEKERLILEQKNIQDGIKRIETERQRIKARIKEAESRLSVGRALQSKAPGEVMGEARAMTLLIIQSQIENAYEKLLGLEEVLYQELPSQSDQLALNLVDAENQLAQISITKAHAISLSSEYPVGPGKPMIAALSLTIGAILGVFGAFFAEFLSRARTVASQRTNKIF